MNSRQLDALLKHHYGPRENVTGTYASVCAAMEMMRGRLGQKMPVRQIAERCGCSTFTYSPFEWMFFGDPDVPSPFYMLCNPSYRPPPSPIKQPQVERWQRGKHGARAA